MTFKLINFNETIDLSSLETQKKVVGNKLFNLVKSQIDMVIQAVKNNTFDFPSFTFLRDPKSGLTDYSGFYLIINKETKKVYLGCTSDLSQRKGEHNNRLKNPTKDMSLSMREDATTHGSDSFYFVPLLSIAFSNFQGLFNSPKTQRQTIVKFLETYVETGLLEFYLNSDYKDMFYNVKVTSEFEAGNTFARSSSGGKPSKHVCFKNYAWESINCASGCFRVDNATIRFKISRGIMTLLSDEEFNNFSGNKILNTEAKIYFLNKPKEYQNLNKILFPIASKRNV